MTRRRRIVLLAGAAVLVLAGALVVGYLPSRVDGGVEPAVRRVLAFLQRLGAPGWVDYDLADFVANIGFFVPIGLVAALLLPWRMWWLAIPAGALLSGALEFGQYLFLPERYASWSDVLANSLGALTGALIGAAIRAARHVRRPEAAPPPARPAAPR
ncbi:MAG TPA: VanZ family protein [Pseudolysinimonas sp.]|jgi:VanZ family protein|nr:VanZ family protein [Pseudolysinimonas sp.]